MRRKAPGAVKPHGAARRYKKALLAGDDSGAFRIIHELLGAGRSLGDMYMMLLTPALTEIGDLWASGDIGVAHEHLATQIVLNHMDRLRSLFSSSQRSSSLRVLVGAVEGEQHSVAARMVADLFLIKGWEVDFLGADIPMSAILDMINIRRPDLVSLSATAPQGTSHVQRLLKQLKDITDPPKLLLGGQAFTSDALWRRGYENCRIAKDVVQGVSIAGRFLPRDRPRAVLKEYLKELGRRVRELRVQRAWTQEQLAEASKLTRGFIVSVEGGNQNVSIDVVVRLANALGISPENLFVDKNVFSRFNDQGR
jgi:MerR family transcriptional regulator, light-induced transcriptional regulator